MNRLAGLLVAALAASALSVTEAEAKRFGGGASIGKQYSGLSRTPPPPRGAAPAPVQRTPAAAAANPAAGTSRWLGPLAGLAAGGLLAALFFGDAFEGLQIMDLLVVAALLFGALMLFRARTARASPEAAGAGIGGPLPPVGGEGGPPFPGTVPGVGSRSEGEAPRWFDAGDFVARAKSHFLRLQAAWDGGDFDAIGEYATPELLAALRREWERAGRPGHHTEVLMLEAELVGLRREGSLVVASVRFGGMTREEAGDDASPFGEVWHVVHDWESPGGDWLIAGIQQLAD
jgi:predicted lipid-binding transport protein (Tim44 family)